MKKILAAVAIGAVLALAMPARAQFDAGTNYLKSFVLVTNITASGTNSIAFTNVGYVGTATFILTAACTNGTNPTLDTKLQGSNDYTTWTDITGGAFAQATTCSVQVLNLRIQDQPLYIRLTNTVGGSSSPGFIYSVNMLAPQKYR